MTTPSYSRLSADHPSVEHRARRPWVFLGIFTLALVLGAAFILPGDVQANVEEHHHDHHDHAHTDHDHAHHDHAFHGDSRRSEHHCIHDKIDHPTIVRGPMRLNAGPGPEIDNSFVDDEVNRRVSVNDIQGTSQNVEAWAGNPDSADANTQYTENTCETASVHNPANTANAIRIQIVDGGISTLTSAYQTYLQNTLMPAVKSYFESTLKVARLSSNLKCAQSGDITSIPLSMGTTCNTAGYASTDFVLFYAASDSTTCQGSTSTIAYAAPLETMDCDRPVVGYIHFCKNALTSVDTTSSQHALQFKTGLHEAIHALGMTSRMYAYYHKTVSPYNSRTTRDANGIPNSGSQTIDTSTTGLSSLGNFKIYKPAVGYFVSGTVADSTLGHVISYFTSEMSNLMSYARTQFSCNTLARVEMENQGNSGSWGSHFEKRIFGDELMTSVVTGYNSPLSSVTLALLEDTGFYKITSHTAAYSSGQLTSGAEENLWLKAAGCSATTDKCVTSSTPQTNTPWCNTVYSTNTHQCTYDNLAKGSCNRKTLSANAAASFYQYFDDTTSYGEVADSDYCPFVQYFSNGKCTDTANSNSELTGEVYSSSSRCFTSSLANPAYSFTTPTVGCYSSECLSTTSMAVSATIGSNTYVVTCTSTGTQHSIPGMTGVLTCPDVSKSNCPGTSSFQSLSSLTVVTDPAGTSLTLLPAFTSAETSYRVLTLSTETSVKITAVSTTNGATATIGGVAATTAGSTHERVVAISAGVNTVPVVITSGGVSKTYTVTITRSDSASTTLYQKWTLNYDFNSVTSTFGDTFKAELQALLGLASSNTQIEMGAVTSGSTIATFTLKTAVDAFSPATLDATLTAIQSDATSSMYMLSSTYPLLSKATALASGVAVACDVSCLVTDCDPSNGKCVTDSSKPWYEEYPFLLYSAVALVAIMIGFFLYCIIKCLCCKTTQPHSAGDKTTFSAPQRNDSPKPRREPVSPATPPHQRFDDHLDHVSVNVEMQLTSKQDDQDAKLPAAVHEFAAPRRGRPGVATARDSYTESSQSESDIEDGEQQQV